MNETLNALNTYEGDNIWQDIIIDLPGYNEAYTAELDPSGASDRIAFDDGTVIAWSPQTGRWAEVSQ